MGAFLALFGRARLACLVSLVAGSALVGLAFGWRPALEQAGVLVGERTQELNARQVVISGRFATRIAIAHAVIDGQLSLAEAIGRFHELETSPPTFSPENRFALVETTLAREDRLGRYVLLFVEYVLRDTPDHKTAVIERLNSELRERRETERATASDMPTRTPN
jgi:hypothetical protein